MEKTYILTKTDILLIFQAGLENGWNQRSIVAGANGNPRILNFEQFMETLPDIIGRDHESPTD